MTEDQQKQLKSDLETAKFQDVSLSADEVLCSFVFNDHVVQLSSKLKLPFPYEFPIVSMDEKSYKELSPLPHVDNDRIICTLDRIICVPNPSADPSKIILEVMIQARKTVSNGIQKINFEDFDDEFAAYWYIESKNDAADSIVSVTDKPHMVVCCEVLNRIYLADTKQELRQFLCNAGINAAENAKYFACIYLPFSIKIRPPFPKTNYELYKLIQRDKLICDFYNKYITKNKEHIVFIAFSVCDNNALNKDKRHLELWKQFILNNFGKINGFRIGRVPPRILFQYGGAKKQYLKMFHVNDMRQERLFLRGGIGLQNKIKKVAIIGCGSIGSYLAEALAEYGVYDFVLVDREFLSDENIARHFCGYEYVQKSKVEAIKIKLGKQNPNIYCDYYQEDVYEFFLEHIDLLNNCDIIFVAIAEIQIENKIITMVKEKIIKKPVVLMWTEPFGIAGQAVIINNPNIERAKLFDAGFSFLKRVVVNSDRLFKRESGCQSTFVPYAAFSIKRFIYTVLEHLFINIIGKNKDGNYILTWCGSVNMAGEYGCKIADRWIDAQNNKLYIERIS